MECTVCLNEWASDKCIPRYFILSLICVIRMLNCGHSFCEQCLKKMYREKVNVLECPSCLTSHKFSSVEDLTKLIKNFTLLSLVETAKSTPTPGQHKGHSHSLHKSKTTLDSSKLGGAFNRDLDDLEECKSEEEECID